MKTDTPKTIYLKDYTPAPFTITETELDITLDQSETRVIVRLSVQPNPHSKSKSRALQLDGEMLTLHRVAIDGMDVTQDAYAATDRHLMLHGVPADAFVLEIETSCDPESNKALNGLYRSNGMYCTQCEPEGFRRITYYLDRPDVLSKFRVRIQGDRKALPVLLSNGNLIESGDLDGGQHYAVWEDPFPKPSYLFALVGGDLACVKDAFKTRSGREVDLRIYVEKGKEDRCAWAMEALKKSMRWDETRYGLEYDLDIFMIVAVSDFNMGAMENKGLNIFNDALVLARPDTATDQDYENIESVIAHEYFHNWTGNRVTCRDWFQLCLKEGLTVFRDQEFSADERGAAVERIKAVRALKSGQFPEDSGPLAHPVRPSSFIEINNFYTMTVYEKGAELCRMIQTVLGRDGFRKGLDLYFKRHDGEAVTVEDFVSAMADANTTDLSDFMLWYKQAGRPLLDARFVYSETNKSARLTLTQSYPELPDHDKRKPVPIPFRLGLVSGSGEDVPLTIDGEPVKDGLLLFKSKRQVFTFEGIDARPIPSLLRDFCAPVTMTSSLSERDRLALIRLDTDLFNRWETAQGFALSELQRMTALVQAGETPKANTRFIAALGEVACDESLDHAYRAAVLTIPSADDVAHAIGENIDPEAIYRAREILRAALGKGLRKILEQIYENSVPAEPYSPDADGVGRRNLRSRALSLLVAGGSRFATAQVKALARQATNMTDTMGALAILASMEGDGFDEALRRFERQWKGEPLVMDKWFRIQAWSPRHDSLERVAKLSTHPLFTLKNPNRARALYGAFAHGNHLHFNNADGKGYDMIADVIMEIDGFNPQVASRLTGQFESWRLLEPKRRAHAEQALQRIAGKPGLSRDVSEIAGKIVGPTLQHGST